MEQDSNSQTGFGLPQDAVERVTLEARKEGVFAGLTGGLASAVIGGRLFGFKRNATLFCGARKHLSHLFKPMQPSLHGLHSQWRPFGLFFHPGLQRYCNGPTPRRGGTASVTSCQTQLRNSAGLREFFHITTASVACLHGWFRLS
ncbi:hypothetical protein M413DRAFT_273100 [Hebeloma cylindrosporum]|uniref:Uncharacterized protein n=1 Tax=Hebeloma cylindrosporum TaxID=76867 RepID=A0A0C2YBW6_HEBCY|nr:hypothetical protein M413DRAFT_273100 [Hebeloma cylindrosporum h7]